MTAFREVDESGVVVQRFIAPRNAATELFFGDPEKAESGNREKKVRFAEPLEVKVIFVFVCQPTAGKKL